MTQISTSLDPAIGLEGMPVDGAHEDDVTVHTTVAINHGRGVVHDGSADHKAGKLPESAADVAKFMGVLKLPTGREPGPLAAECDGSLRRKGRIMVLVEVDVLKDEPAFLRHAAGGNGLGAWRNDATGAAPVPGASFYTNALAGELAVLELG